MMEEPHLMALQTEKHLSLLFFFSFFLYYETTVIWKVFYLVNVLTLTHITGLI